MNYFGGDLPPDLSGCPWEQTVCGVHFLFLQFHCLRVHGPSASLLISLWWQRSLFKIWFRPILWIWSGSCFHSYHLSFYRLNVPMREVQRRTQLILRFIDALHSHLFDRLTLRFCKWASISYLSLPLSSLCLPFFLFIIAAWITPSSLVPGGVDLVLSVIQCPSFCWGDHRSRAGPLEFGEWSGTCHGIFSFLLLRIVSWFVLELFLMFVKHV